MTGQAGLRLINNNYVARGDGRDALLYYDAHFRGGKVGGGAANQHMPSPQAGVAKPLRPGGSSLGFGARVEGHTQHLNLSKSSFANTSERKLRMTAEGWCPGPASPSRTSLASHAATLEHSLTRSRSEPGKAFSPVWRESSLCGGLHFSTSKLNLLGGVEDSVSFTAKISDGSSHEPEWTKPVRWKTSQCISRTPGGGFWAK
mmetsp:Transcript_143536/g.357687  ORF Transcript_143536/g.357687 Transcript_143536/m.357687 type:complete len:202 (+) Transcript_143536:76-681(+)